MEDGLLSLKWNNHCTTIVQLLRVLRQQGFYTDALVVCGGRFYGVHRIVLMACSDFFCDIFSRVEDCPKPVLVLHDIACPDLEALLDYMYLGETDVEQNQLASLIRAAECLQIKGLAVNEDDSSQPLIKLTNTTNKSNKTSNSGGTTHVKHVKETNGKESLQQHKQNETSKNYQELSQSERNTERNTERSKHFMAPSQNERSKHGSELSQPHPKRRRTSPTTENFSPIQDYSEVQSDDNKNFVKTISRLGNSTVQNDSSNSARSRLQTNRVTSNQPLIPTSSKSTKSDQEGHPSRSSHTSLRSPSPSSQIKEEVVHEDLKMEGNSEEDLNLSLTEDPVGHDFKQYLQVSVDGGLFDLTQSGGEVVAGGSSGSGSYPPHPTLPHSLLGDEEATQQSSQTGAGARRLAGSDGCGCGGGGGCGGGCGGDSGCGGACYDGRAFGDSDGSGGGAKAATQRKMCGASLGRRHVSNTGPGTHRRQCSSATSDHTNERSTPVSDRGKYISPINDRENYKTPPKDRGSYVPTVSDRGNYNSSEDRGSYISTVNDRANYNTPANNEGNTAVVPTSSCSTHTALVTDNRGNYNTDLSCQENSGDLSSPVKRNTGLITVSDYENIDTIASNACESIGVTTSNTPRTSSDVLSNDQENVVIVSEVSGPFDVWSDTNSYRDCGTTQQQSGQRQQQQYSRRRTPQCDYAGQQANKVIGNPIVVDNFGTERCRYDYQEEKRSSPTESQGEEIKLIQNTSYDGGQGSSKNRLDETTQSNSGGQIIDGSDMGYFYDQSNDLMAYPNAEKQPPFNTESIVIYSIMDLPKPHSIRNIGFSCGHCLKMFYHRGNFICHLSTHTGEKPYVCSHCSFKSSRKGNLESHVRSKHQIDLFEQPLEHSV